MNRVWRSAGVVAPSVVLAGCSLFSDLAGPSIECRGDPLPADVCRQWGRSIIEWSESRGQRPAKVVLTFGAGANEKCFADVYAATGVLLTTANARCPEAD